MEDFDEDDDDSEEDSEEEDEKPRVRARKRKRRKRTKGTRNEFIIDEAEVDDDVESDDDWEEGAEDIIDKSNKPQDQNTARDLDSHRRLQKMFEDQGAEEIEEYYRKKYADQAAQERNYFEGEGDLPEDIAQQALMPGVKDPNLWMVKCRIGDEKNAVLQLMRKFIAFENSDKVEPLLIKSAIAPEGVKGFIYIEAFKQTHVQRAIENIGALKMGQWNQKMISLKEMTDVLKVTKEQTVLRPKQWVRLKRGIYKDDLAQVDQVDQAQGQCCLKLLPRIDYTRMRGALKETMSENQKRKKGKRPPAKFFDHEAIRAIGGDITREGDFDVFERNRYTQGFLYKDFSISAILVDGVKPSLTELQKFEEQPQVDGAKVDIEDTHVSEDKGHNFAQGDVVEVTQGELLHLHGKIISIEGDKINICPKHEDLKEALEFQAHELRKYFAVGDHVKVIGGQYEGDTGLVVRVDEKQIVIFSDLTMHEIKLFPKDLQLCTDMATGVDSMGQFQLGDLVQLDAQTVGVITRLEKEYFQILNMHGKMVQVKHQAVTKRRDSKRAVALDSEQNTLQVKDHVKVIDGPHSGRQGEIRHLYRNYAFIHSRMLLGESGGIFVCKSRNLVLAGGNRPLSSSNYSSNAPYMSPRVMASPRHGGAGGSGGGGMRTPMMNRGGRDRSDLDLIGKTIKITQGTYKGYIGIVKDAIGSTARVELHASCQTITVDKQRIEVVGGQTGARQGNVSSYSRTPMYGSQTPMASRTPMYDAGSRTPRQGMTPVYDPSRTPVHGSAWDAAAATPRPDFENDYNNEPSPDTKFNPPTPGYANPDTPNAPYTPQTPGMYGGGGYDAEYGKQSPQGYSPSPGGQYQYSQSPSPTGYGAGGVTPSPQNFAFSPMTPGGGGFNPHTPGAGIEHNLGEWQTTDIEVRIRRSHDDTDLIGQTGVIRGISGGMCSVFLPTEDRVVNILSEHLEPVPPKPKDHVSCG